MLEDFIKSRGAEVLQRVGAGRTSFIDLPSGIRDAATAGVVKALRFQDQWLDRRAADYHVTYQNHARAIASTGTSPYEISTLAFANDQANLNAEVVSSVLEAFRVENPWSAMGSVASRANIGVLDLKGAMSAAAARRHAAAHKADAIVEIGELQAFEAEAVGIALSFDLLLSVALRKLLDADRDYLTRQRKVAGKDATFRIIEYAKGWWREIVPPGVRAYKRSKDENPLRSECSLRARAAGQAVIIRGAKGFPAEWFTPDVD
jgi:hypothetical protein